MSENNEKRNAHVQQDRNRTSELLHSQFDNIGLTKRNAEYMFKFNQALGGVKLKDEQKSELVDQMVKDLLEGQKSGKTARNMWGTVDQKIDNVVNPPKKAANPVRDYWPNAAYNTLLFFTIFNLLYGITFLFSKNAAATTMGITGIILSSIIAGLGIPLMTMLIAPGVKHKYSLPIRILFIAGFFVVWMAVFFIAGLIPRVINPILNPYVYIALGVLSIGGSVWFKRRYNITGGLF
ncbi:hypothetical protein PL11_001650 [Lentilactobacillus curieae]|uniref:DUF1129 domain-containing protein n=1 Tax=Lentilactobacillus curieae TaxID=1138822 RepID=A0A1S6QGI4_9LACO|nr:DUF1129 domain-containing protein [Lentilactobacillus curieae]AQW20710.1 hypothetical protein PL11_001650 [Lentilactobacillus curieae]